MFSSRLPIALTHNRIADAERAARASGAPLLDLTQSNPTLVGLAYPDDLLAPLAGRAGLRYEPCAQGLAQARDAVATDFRRRGVAIDPDDLVLTASTSEAYSFLLKLLCAPGHAVHVPAPSYPLLDHLCALDGVRTVPFSLEYHVRWSIDLARLRRSVSRDSRAIVLVQPNNPTGSCATAPELDEVRAVCRRGAMPLIVDEVFADYGLDGGEHAAPAGSPAGDILTFRLGGLSKTIGLPQAKLAWIALQGPDDRRRQARERLQLIADMYLSVSTPVQLAASSLLEAGQAIRAQIRERLVANLRLARALVAEHPACQLLNVEAGWSVVIQVPATRSEEDLAVELIEQDGVIVHPGYFFDFPREAFAVVSLLTPPAELRNGLARLLERAEAG